MRFPFLCAAPYAECCKNSAPALRYWRVTATSTQTRSCNIKDACVGGAPTTLSSRRSLEQSIWAEHQCAEGYQSPLCGACAPDHHQVATGECKKCDGSEWASWVLAGVVIVACVVLFGYVLLHGGVAEDGSVMIGGSKKRAGKGECIAGIERSFKSVLC